MTTDREQTIRRLGWYTLTSIGGVAFAILVASLAVDTVSTDTGAAMIVAVLALAMSSTTTVVVMARE